MMCDFLTPNPKPQTLNPQPSTLNPKRAALKAAVGAEDDLVLCDFLGNVSRHQEIWSIDSFLLLLPSLARSVGFMV
jgi:hypothetical protein